jgi:hypothetical protein
VPIEEEEEDIKNHIIIIIIITTPKLGHSVHLGLLEFPHIGTVVASSFAVSFLTIITNT